MNKKRQKTVGPEWTEAKLEKAEAVLRRVHIHEPFFSQIVFWSAILVIVLGNLLMSLALIPFLAVFNRWFLDLIILTVALVMGFLFNFLITNIGHLEKHHHYLAAVILPIIAVLNMVFVVTTANEMIDALQIANARQNPWLLGILYGAAFILPYIYFRLRKVYK